MVIKFNPIISVVIYFFIFLLTSILIDKAKSNKKLFFTSLIICILLFGFRYCGTDILTYKQMVTRYASMSIMDMLNFNNLFEGIGFQVLSHYAFKLGGFSLVNMIVGMLILYPVYIVLYRNRYNTNVFLFSFIYLIAFFTTSFNIMRQFVAISFVFLGYDYLINKQLKKYFLCLIGGFLFHSTAIIGFSFLMVNIIVNSSKKLTRYNCFKILLSFLVILFVIGFSGRYILISSYAGYIENAKAGGNRDFLVIVFKFLVLLVLKKRLSKLDIRFDDYFIFCLFTVMIGITGFISAYIKRLYYYFNIFECFSFAMIPIVFKQKRLVTCGIILSYTGLFILTSFVLSQGHIIPLILKIGG